MFSTCSELTPRSPIRDGRMAQFMQPWSLSALVVVSHYATKEPKCISILRLPHPFPEKYPFRVLVWLGSESAQCNQTTKPSDPSRGSGIIIDL